MPPSITTTNPATGEAITTYGAVDRDGACDLLAKAHAAQVGWGATPITDRVAVLRGVGERLRGERDDLAALITSEMGKPIAEARAEVEKSAIACDYYAAHGPSVLEAAHVDIGGRRAWTAREPLGVILGIMPWNFPIWQVIRFAAPTLLAGNTAMLKHAPEVSGCAVAIEAVFQDAGLPLDVLRAVLVASEDVPEVTGALIDDHRIAAVSLTGSERAGSAVAARAGAAIKKTVLELGGSDPFVVLADADLDAALAGAVTSRFVNTGQSCLAAKRLIVHHSVAEEFTHRLTATVERLVVGDPTDTGTDIGPLARNDLVDVLADQVDASVRAGAVVCTGATRLGCCDSWYAPTVLTQVTTAMPVATEETFGPVASILVVDNDEEAIRIADATGYGLGASVWDADTERALSLGRRITSGALFVNAVVASDARLPFGGTRRSGYGRELGTAGITEFTNLRTYVVGG